MNTSFYSNYKYKWPVFFLLCILSRLVTSIFYIEDIDSLRFALSAYHYDVLSNQPHFPGYPFFCFFFNLFYHLTGSLGFSASIIGGVAIFIIIFFTLKIYYLFFNKNSLFLSCLLFFNPFLWIMGNRYMPDLLGLSLLVGGLYFFLLCIKNKSKKNLILFGLFVGLLSGVRISYLPFFLSAIYLFFNVKKSIFFIYSSFCFFLIWFIPWICITDLQELINVAINDSQGHFFRWGGTIFSENSTWFVRFNKILESLLSDSFGMWWIGRHWLTALNSLFLFCFALIAFITSIFNLFHIRKEIIIIFCSFILYFIWVFLFQNIVYKPRHLMPFIPLICVFFTIGFNTIYQKINSTLIKRFIYIALIPYCMISFKLTYQHTYESAISQAAKYISNDQSKKIVIISHELMNYYFSKTLDGNFIYLNSSSFHNKLNYYYENNFRIISTVKLSSKNYNLVNQSPFFHNPYVNKLWSNLSLYEYKQ
mgnify:CR=1 FL=1